MVRVVDWLLSKYFILDPDKNIKVGFFFFIYLN